MRDYLLRFADRASAEAAYAPAEDGAPCWALGEATVMPVTVWLLNPALDAVDDEGRPVRGRQPAAGYWLGVAAPDDDAPPPVTAIAMQRPAASRSWRACVIATLIDPLPAVESVSPVFAGSSYVFD